jgi:hypothetical protein
MIRLLLPLSFIAVLGLPVVAAQGQDSAPMSRAEYQKAIADSQKTIAESRKAIAELKQQLPGGDGLSPPPASASEATKYELPPVAEDAAKGLAPLPGASASEATKYKLPPVAEDAAKGLAPPPGSESGEGSGEKPGVPPKPSGDGALPTEPDHLPITGDGSSPPGATGKSAADGAAKITALEDRLHEVEVIIGQIAKAVDTPDGRVHVVDLERNMKYATRSTGRLRIRNKMSTGQAILVNGRNWVQVAAQSTEIVEVPRGTVTTELPGEGAKNWFIGLPDYTEDITIAPANQNPAYAATPGYGPWQYDCQNGVWFCEILR